MDDGRGTNTGNVWTWKNVGGIGVRVDSACQTVSVEAFPDYEFSVRHFHSGVLSVRGWIPLDRANWLTVVGQHTPVEIANLTFLP